MLKVRADRPVDPMTVAVLRRADAVLHALKIRYFVTGAKARDILLTNVFAQAASRATRDVDVAIAVEDWNQFEAVRDALRKEECFRPVAGMAHRFRYYADATGEGYPLDIVPFGGVEEPDMTVAWPPDRAVVMNVAGHREALEAAELVEIEPGFRVCVASVPGITMLKLIAWADRSKITSKDALDIALMIRRYEDTGIGTRLYGAEFAVLESVDFDVDLAAAKLLGSDVARLARRDTADRISALLRDAQTRNALIAHMAREWGAETGIDTAGRLLASFESGFESRRVND